MKDSFPLLYFSFFCFFLVLTLTKVQTTSVDKCIVGSGALPEETDIYNCNQPPCIFYINANSSMSIKFRSPRYMENFAPQALALVEGLQVSYPLGQDDGCKGVTNTPCPLAENEFIEYTYTMFILPIFPKIAFTLEFSLVDKDLNEQFECFRVNIQLM